jgi:regulator of protease activity HflC (stomatin/prohibitin superfamily)
MGEQAHIYSATQTAVRTVVAGVTMEALLTQRVAIGAQLRELIAPQAEAVRAQVHAVEVRDVMLPGELRKAFSEVLKAKQEGQAALEAPAVNLPHSAISRTRRASSKASRLSRHSASCKRSKRPMRARPS